MSDRQGLQGGQLGGVLLVFGCRHRGTLGTLGSEQRILPAATNMVYRRSANSLARWHMIEHPAKLNRRQALKVIAGAVLAPVGAVHARAANLPQVSEDDPIAAGLKYRHDATRARRADKAGIAAAQQFCSGCRFSEGEGEWVSCTIIPGQAVNARGWCTAWAPRSD